MTLDEAKEELKDFIQPDGSLSHGVQYISWDVGDDEVELDASFSTKEIEAIVLYVRSANNLEDGTC